MAKYNFEFKKKIVLEHLSLGVGSETLAKKYNVKSARQIRQWIHNYDTYIRTTVHHFEAIAACVAVVHP